MHSKIAMSPFASMLPHLCENDNNFEIKLRIVFVMFCLFLFENAGNRRVETSYFDVKMSYSYIFTLFQTNF